jgi:hypothetical protein
MGGARETIEHSMLDVTNTRRGPNRGCGWDLFWLHQFPTPLHKNKSSMPMIFLSQWKDYEIELWKYCSFERIKNWKFQHSNNIIRIWSCQGTILSVTLSLATTCSQAQGGTLANIVHGLSLLSMLSGFSF